jgi:hypothetical protein
MNLFLIVLEATKSSWEGVCLVRAFLLVRSPETAQGITQQERYRQETEPNRPTLRYPIKTLIHE